MIIGVDAGALSITDERLKVGVWRVTYNLLKELSKIDATNEYRLYSFHPIKETFGINFRNIVVRPRFGWSRISLPIELRRHPVDVFLGLSQMVPFCRAKTIGFVHDLGFLHYPDAYPDSFSRLKKQTEYLIRQADTIITFSKVTAGEIHKPNVHVLHEGVDSIFTPMGKKHTSRVPYILTVGSLKRIKNIPLAIRVVKNTPYNLVLVGGNYWEDPQIGKEIEELKMEKRVKIKGFIPDKELAEYYRGAKALLITSLWEGFCLPAIEAIACGCPVVYKNTGSLPEIIGNAGLSFVTETEAVKALLKRKSTGAGITRSKQLSWSRFAKAVYRIITLT